ncbi:hypothetical protein AU509_17040 [Lonsdalea britannica]|uniref:Uncharacterized protein n=1 Tax=Lonsdalea britannica TaxID=1082704 RepID=A0AAD0SK21_9GAMM|nr:hypothetical protein [Lonsdalea britannica]AXW85581.1 hypothetical protein CKQ53_00320 [Lonsdalea britannica]AXW88704.1 hypothetical protein CKQ53_18145 [Lonsdalea britannica]OSM93822.1 hypothetical protein AU509_17040 [Lonsdalea britannica]OSN02890.1 hypothetical protein AU510_16480 [Lonsdalea britannica]
MKYRYTGPTSGVTLADGTEVLLFPQRAVELPAEHDYVKTLVALGLLQPLENGASITTNDEVNHGS